MGALLAYGIELIICIAFSLILMVIGLFVRHTIIFDSIALGIISGVCCNHFFTFHPAFCLLIGIAVFAGLLFLQNTRFGFWIIGVIMSAAWAFVFAFFAYIFAGEDMIWFYVILGLSFIVMLLLRIRARDKA